MSVDGFIGSLYDRPAFLCRRWGAFAAPQAVNVRIVSCRGRSLFQRLNITIHSRPMTNAVTMGWALGRLGKVQGAPSSRPNFKKNSRYSEN